MEVDGWLGEVEAKSPGVCKTKSRAQTIIAALERTSEESSGENYPRNPLIIHILGADLNEGNSPTDTMELFGELFSWAVRQWDDRMCGNVKNLITIELLLCGPNLPLHLTGTTHELHWRIEEVVKQGQHLAKMTGEDNAELEPACRVILRYDSSLYHELSRVVFDGPCGHHPLPAGPATTGIPSPPSLIICFNAGIWGYTDWIPTLNHALRASPNVPLVITAYTELEAEEDEEAIESGVTAPKRWLWGPEPNPYASLQVRRCHGIVPGSPNFENGAWQCLQGLG